MNEENPYRAPDAEIAAPLVESDTTLPLAGRVERLLAAIVDTVLIVAVSFPLLFLIGYFDTSDNGGLWFSIVEEILISVGFFLLFLMIQGYPLHKSGQTWGKRLLGIRIVDQAGRKPEFWRLTLLRYLPFDAMASIPVVGWLIAAIDSLMIFRDDRRCLHDILAGTRVVVVERPDRP